MSVMVADINVSRTSDSPTPPRSSGYPCCEHCPRDCEGMHAGPCLDCQKERR